MYLQRLIQRCPVLRDSNAVDVVGSAYDQNSARRSRLDRCGRSGRPLLAICPNGHARRVPLRLLKTSEQDRTPIYGRLFRCPECARPEADLFDIESLDELDEVRRNLAGPPEPAKAPTTHATHDPSADLP